MNSNWQPVVSNWQQAVSSHGVLSANDFAVLFLLKTQGKSTLKWNSSAYKKDEHEHIGSWYINQLFIKGPYTDVKFFKN